MATSGTLPRRLSFDGCKTAGTQVAAEAAALKQGKVKLDKEVVAALEALHEATEALKITSQKGDMRPVDRGVDSAVAALDDVLEGKAGGYGGEDALPLEATERAEQELAIKVRQALFFDGTGFVQLPYRQQWARLERLSRALTECAGDLKALGLSTQASRLQRWIVLYGDRLGVTSSQQAADQEAKAIDAWHSALQELVDVARYHLRGDAASLSRLLGAYEQQVAAERDANARHKGRKKAPEA